VFCGKQGNVKQSRGLPKLCARVQKSLPSPEPIGCEELQLQQRLLTTTTGDLRLTGLEGNHQKATQGDVPVKPLGFSNPEYQQQLKQEVGRF